MKKSNDLSFYAGCISIKAERYFDHTNFNCMITKNDVFKTSKIIKKEKKEYALFSMERDGVKITIEIPKSMLFGKKCKVFFSFSLKFSEKEKNRQCKLLPKKAKVFLEEKNRQKTFAGTVEVNEEVYTSNPYFLLEEENRSETIFLANNARHPWRG